MKYYEIFRLSVIHSLKNYKALLGLAIFLITCLVIFAHLWKVMAKKFGSFDLNPDQLLWYIAMNQWVLVSLPDPQDAIQEDLQSGRLAYLILRPISYLGATFFEAFGILCTNLTLLGVVSFGYAWMSSGSIPFGAGSFLVMLMMTLLAGSLAILFLMLIGLSSFWIFDVNPVYWIWEKFCFVLGGLIIPLAAYPIWLQNIAQWTPFPPLLSQRSSLVFQYDIGSVSLLLVTFLIWILVAIVGLSFLYRKGLKVLIIEGG